MIPTESQDATEIAATPIRECDMANQFAARPSGGITPWSCMPSFDEIRHLLSNRPLRRPNRNKPLGEFEAWDRASDQDFLDWEKSL